MVNFIYTLFKSEETKINEDYEPYKKKYGDKIKILRQGDMYAIEDSLSFRRNLKFTTPFYYNLQDAKKRYIQICKYYETNQLPIVEI